MTARNLVKIVLPIIVLLLAGLVYFSLVDGKVEKEKPVLKEKVWLVEVQQAIKQSLSPAITLYGRIESPETMNVAAPGGGVVEGIYVRNGALVSKGQALVKLDPRDFSSSLNQAKADLSDINNQIEELSIRHQSNQATLATERNLFALAKAEVDRLVKLQQQNLSNESAVNNARSTLGKQQLAVLSRQLEVESYPAKLEILKARRDFNRAKVAESSLAMERAQMKAPFDAVISQVFVADGDRVMLGQSLLSLFPLSSLEIRAHLPTAYVDQIRQAMSGGVTLTAGIEKRDELGKFILTRIAGRAETSGIDVYFKAQDTNSQLRPGELLPLSLHLPEMDNVIAIPYQAIYGNSVVYLMRQGRMQAIEVSSVGQQVNIEGQRILLIRSESIESGDHIIVTHLPNAVSGLKVTSSENATNN